MCWQFVEGPCLPGARSWCCPASSSSHSSSGGATSTAPPLALGAHCSICSPCRLQKAAPTITAAAITTGIPAKCAWVGLRVRRCDLHVMHGHSSFDCPLSGLCYPSQGCIWKAVIVAVIVLDCGIANVRSTSAYDQFGAPCAGDMARLHCTAVGIKCSLKHTFWLQAGASLVQVVDAGQTQAFAEFIAFEGGRFCSIDTLRLVEASTAFETFMSARVLSRCVCPASASWSQPSRSWISMLAAAQSWSSSISERQAQGLALPLEFYTLLSYELQRKGLGMWRSDHASAAGPHSHPGSRNGKQKGKASKADVKAGKSPDKPPSNLTQLLESTTPWQLCGVYLSSARPLPCSSL